MGDGTCYQQSQLQCCDATYVIFYTLKIKYIFTYNYCRRCRCPVSDQLIPVFIRNNLIIYYIIIYILSSAFFTISSFYFNTVTTTCTYKNVFKTKEVQWSGIPKSRKTHKKKQEIVINQIRKLETIVVKADGEILSIFNKTAPETETLSIQILPQVSLLKLLKINNGTYRKIYSFLLCRYVCFRTRTQIFTK